MSRRTRRRRAVAVLLALGLVGVMVVPVLATYYGFGTGQSWVTEFLAWHTGHSRTSYFANGSSGQRYIQVVSSLYYSNGGGWIYWCDDYDEKYVYNDGFVDASCTKFTALSYDWLAAGAHSIVVIDPYTVVYTGESYGGP